MNICIITPRYPYGNNMEFVFVKKIVDEWAKMGHSCVVITVFSWTSFMKGRISYRPNHYQDKIDNEIVVDVYEPRTISLGIKLGNVSFDSIMASTVLKRQLEKLKIKFDFFYCHFISSALLVFNYAKSNKIPLFLATGESCYPKLDKPYKSFLWKDFIEYVSGVIAVSSKNKTEAWEKGFIDKEKCIVVPNGTDISIFKPLNRDSCRNVLNFSKDLFIISCVGFICERKGQNRLMDAIRKLADNNIRVLFIGKEAQIESFTLKGDEILYKGTIENKQLPLYLNASNVFCLPTKAEGCCNAIIEALACGLPIISSNLPFNWDVLDESNSILINPEDIEDIAYAIRTLRQDNIKREKLAAGALKRSANLSIQQRAENILFFINQRMMLK